MSREAMRRAMVVFAGTAALVLLALYLTVRYAIRYPQRPLEQPGRQVKLVIPKGVNFPEVLRRLERAGVVHNPLAFRIYTHYRGKASRVRAGRYTIDTSVTPEQLLEILVRGVPAPQVSVLIPEGKQMLEVADLLAAGRVADRRALVAKMRDVRFLRRIGVPGRTIEGFLFPDTYRFRQDTAPETVLKAMFQRHRRVYVELRSRHPGGLKRLRSQLGWGHREIVILASIVEKETGQARERPVIAGVFVNRLTFEWFQPKLLQTDPTIVYGCTVPRRRSPACERFEGRIRRIHLEDRANPYNTYTHEGLPPGPIANPGRAALEAVLAPERSRYLYFVAKNDGSHYFSRTKAQHDRAVDYYQRGRGSPPP